MTSLNITVAYNPTWLYSVIYITCVMWQKVVTSSGKMVNHKTIGEFRTNHSLVLSTFLRLALTCRTDDVTFLACFEAFFKSLRWHKWPVFFTRSTTSLTANSLYDIRRIGGSEFFLYSMNRVNNIQCFK